MDSSRYESRGVSADKKEVHQAIHKLDQGLFNNTFCKVLNDPFSKNDEDCIMLHADTAGTKTILAYLYWKETGDLTIWKGIAQDALVMNIDDMAVSGAVDRFIISNTLLRNKKLIPGEVLQTIIDGTLDFMDQMAQFGIHMHHAGGETADVGDVIRTTDVGYTVYASLKKDKVFRIDIQPGDVILGIGSAGQTIYESNYNSGISCNGLTSARHDVLSKMYSTKYPESYDPALDPALTYVGKYRIQDMVQDKSGGQHMIGDLLLSPTRTFLPLLKKIVDHKMDGLHGIVHATGGAHSKVLKFASNVKIIKNRIPDPPIVFDIIQECSNASPEEMYKVFNMGIRLEIYGSIQAIEQIIPIANELKLPNQIIGHVVSGTTSPVVEMQVNEKKWNYHE